MKTNNGLVEYCFNQLGLPYWWGTYGNVASKSLYEQKKTQYPSQYTWSNYQKDVGKRVHDCVGLIKGYLWTNDGKLKYNASQDKDVSGMLANCNEIGDIKNLPETKGVLVFMPKHVGVYIGNGEVIEARGHKFGVVKTKLIDRPWTTYGKLKWITYEEELKMFEVGDEQDAIKFLSNKGVIDNEIFWQDALKYYKNLNYLIIKFANTLKEQKD